MAPTPPIWGETNGKASFSLKFDASDHQLIRKMEPFGEDTDGFARKNAFILAFK